MIPRLRPTLGWQELIAAWTPTNSEDVARFEAAFAELMGVKHAVAFPYGRTGLVFLLQALGVQNKEVICPAYTCVVVPHAIVTSGNEPVFIDSQDYDFNMNLDLAEAAIGEQTGGLIPTSIFGYPVDLDRLDVLKKRYPHIAIIRDCAHSFGAEWKVLGLSRSGGRPVQQAGDAAIFGLGISKLITSIFGGMVTTDRDNLAAELRRLRNKRIHAPSWKKSWLRRFYLTTVYPTFTGPIYDFTNALERRGLLDRFVKYYDERVIDMPTDYLVGMTGIEAKVGEIQVRRYHEIIDNRRKIATFYNEHLGGLPGLRLPPLIEGATYSHYVPRADQREELMVSALKSGVQLGQLIEYNIPEMPAYRKRPVSRYLCPVASQMAKETVNLPISMGLNAAAKVVAVLRKVLAGQKYT